MRPSTALLHRRRHLSAYPQMTSKSQCMVTLYCTYGSMCSTRSTTLLLHTYHDLSACLLSTEQPVQVWDDGHSVQQRSALKEASGIIAFWPEPTENGQSMVPMLRSVLCSMRVLGSTAAETALPVCLSELAMNGNSSRATEVSLEDVLHGWVSCAVVYHTYSRPSRTPKN